MSPLDHPEPFPCSVFLQTRNVKQNWIAWWDPLALLNKHVNFVAMADEIDHWAPRPCLAKGGQQPCTVELMTRLLVLQHIFNLPGEQMEFQLLDRMSLHRFVGLKGQGRLQDRNTFRNFRERLVQAKAEHLIFDEG